MNRRDPLQALQDGTRSKKAGDKIVYSYYDTAVLAVATTAHRLFTVQLGGAKNLSDTNMKTAAQIPNGQKFIVHAMKYMFIGDAAKATADINTYYQMLSNTTLQIVLSGKDDYGTFTLAEILGASEYYSVVPTVAGDNILQNTAITKGVFPLAIPITLAALQNFELLMTHHVAVGAALAGCKIRIALAGKLIRLS